MRRERMRPNDGGICIIKMVTGTSSAEVLIIQPHLNAAKIGIIGIEPPDPYLIGIRDISADSNATWRSDRISIYRADECT